MALELLFHTFGPEFKKKYLKPYYGYNDLGTGTYPRNYFISHDKLGFDINPNIKDMNFYSPNGVIKIFSNHYSCFDQNQNYNNYIYLGGDSFIWGYDDYDKLFGVMLEKKTNNQVAKCGVTNTGQAHQYLKFKEFIKKNDSLPKKIIIGHYKNDLSDDAKFPKDIVINGWLVSKPENSKDVENLKEILLKKEKTHIQKMDNSLFYNLKNQHWFIFFVNNSFLISSVRKYKKRISTFGQKKDLSKQKKKMKNAKCDYDNYNSLKCINKNKEAIIKFINFSKTNNIDLVIILFPPIDSLKNNKDLYKNLKNFLNNLNITYIDLFYQIKSSGIDIDKFYNRDNHFSMFGNKFLLNFNIEKFK